MIIYSRVYLFINCTPPQGVIWRSHNITSCLLGSMECIYLLCANPPTTVPTYLPTIPTHTPTYLTIYFSLSLSLSLPPSLPISLWLNSSALLRNTCLNNFWTGNCYISLTFIIQCLNPNAAADSQRYCSKWPCLHMHRTALSLSAAKSYIQLETGILIKK